MKKQLTIFDLVPQPVESPPLPPPKPPPETPALTQNQIDWYTANAAFQLRLMRLWMDKALATKDPWHKTRYQNLFKRSHHERNFWLKKLGQLNEEAVL